MRDGAGELLAANALYVDEDEIKILEGPHKLSGDLDARWNKELGLELAARRGLANDVPVPALDITGSAYPVNGDE
jgi:hypothetical protein